jgi:hypothetical protein
VRHYAFIFVLLVLLFGAVAPARAASAHDLAGAWKAGYFSTDGQDANVFDITITPTGEGTFIGRSVELNAIAPEAGVLFLVCDIRGTVSGDRVRFTKTYVNTAGVSHTVTYEGALRDGGRRLSGSYQVEAALGAFEMAR